MKILAVSLAACFDATTANAQSEAEADSIAATVDLDEVTVTAKRAATKFTETGLVYDFQADPAVKTMTLLEALRRVPLVTVTADDEVRVKGNSNYAIYMNGRPYRVAQADPKVVLNSIPANTVAKVEVITELDGRYDAEAGSAIINIITVKNTLDGYSLTLNGRVNAKPEHERVIDATNGGVSFLATKGNVNLMLGYDYTLQNVLNQPMKSNFTLLNDKGIAEMMTVNELLKVVGDFNYHTGRMMLEWTPDTLNSLYVDGHAFIDHNHKSGLMKFTETRGFLPSTSSYFHQRTRNTSGTAEANVIYRNYYRNNKDLCRFSLGYRFALDPEQAKDDVTVSPDETGSDGVRTLSTVEGHLQEHTFNADYALPLGNAHTLRLGTKEILRLGRTRPDYMLWEGDGWQPSPSGATDYDGAMNYNQNVAALYAAYNSRLGKFNLAASLRGEYADNSFRLLGEDKRSHYSFIDLIPRMSVTFNQSYTQRYTLTYNTSVSRPGISDLDPFYDNIYTNLQSQGNPDLHQSRTHSISASMLNMSNKLIMQLSATANRTVNPIVDYYTTDLKAGSVLQSKINFGRHDFTSQSIYVGYEPTAWMSLIASANFTENWYRDKSLGMKGTGFDWNLYAAATFTLPHFWTLGAQLMCNRMDTQPYTKYNRTMVIPAFYANKSFMQGRLTAGVALSSPFAKYSHFGSEVRMPSFVKEQRNDILSRGISFKISYRLSGGKQTRLDRDRSLHNDDLTTGVK